MALTLNDLEHAESDNFPSPIYRRPKDDTSKYNRKQSDTRRSSTKLNIDAILDFQLIGARSTINCNHSIEISDANNPYLDQSLIRNTEYLVNGTPSLGYGSSESKEDASGQSENEIEDISSVFRYLKRLGDGASCQVFKVESIKNQEIYALKKMSKANKYNLESFQKERKLLRKMLHPSIVTYHDSFVDNDFYYIATCYASGGTMLDKVMKMQRFSERKASEYLGTLLSAISYMHKLGIAHRDLKCRNIVFDRPGNDGVLQIIDFGCSEILDPKKEYHMPYGTIHYLPPESYQIRSAEDLKKGDIWSLGVIAYILVFGTPPFGGDSNETIFRNIRTQKLHFWENASVHTNSCKNFISRLLEKNPSWRLSADDALKHEWIHGKTASHVNLKTISSSYVECLRAFNGGNKLQHILVNAILNELTEEEQLILEEGLLDMQRASSRCEANHVVDYMVLNSLIQDVPERDEEWKKKRVHDLVHYHSTNSIDVDSFLSPEHAVTANDITSRPNSGRISGRFSSRLSRLSGSSTNHRESFGSYNFNNLDSLRVRRTRENTMSYVAYLDSALHRALALSEETDRETSSIPPLADTPNVSVDVYVDDEVKTKHIRRCSDSLDDVDVSFGNENVDSMEMGVSIPFNLLNAENVEEDVIGNDENQVIDSMMVMITEQEKVQSRSRRAATANEVQSRKISAERFRGIISRHDKKYPTEKMIGDLQDETGHIPLYAIASCNKRYRTLDED